tara:strand:+ start:1821 stop:3305 length:1485 start_codon:yes stop_codon:yes gene_type:complete
MTVLQEPITRPITLNNYVDGEWVASSGELHEVTNPALQEVIAYSPDSSAAETSSAITAAKNAFPDWRQTPPVSRARYLFRLKELMEEHFEELSRIQTLEHGKTIDESRGETRRGIEQIEVATGIPSLLMGYNLEDIASGIDEYVIRQPIGVFGIIPPFNFPFMVPLWFAPYAVAAGNCVIVKPSPRDPISQSKVAELVDEAGFPPGVWNVLHGGMDAANTLIDSPDVDGIAFVGSTPVAKEVYRRCGEVGKRAIAQGGAKNFVVVMPDTDLSTTIPALMTSFYGNSGQRCLSGANLLVVGPDSFYTDFMSEVVSATAKIRVGYGLDESVQMGPMQAPDGKQRVLAYVEEGVDQGAKLRLDGRATDLVGEYPDTCFLNPSIFENVEPDMSIGREEIFGPVMSVMRSGDLNSAIEVIGGNPFGNSACIFTTSGKAAREFQYSTVVGNVGVNIGVAAPMAFFPFGGMKDSFFGILHGQGQDAIRFFTEGKVVVQRWP